MTGRPIGTSNGPARELLPNEIRVLCDSLGGVYAERNRTLVWLCIGAGLRIGEAASLRVRDVRGSSGRCTPDIVIQKRDAKANRSRRVFLLPECIEQIDRYLEGAGDLGDLEPLLQSRKGGHLTANYCSQLVTTLLRKAGVDRASSHSFRRTHANTLRRSPQCDILMIKVQLGHTSLETTAKYLEASPPEIHSAVQSIKIFNKG